MPDQYELPAPPAQPPTFDELLSEAQRLAPCGLRPVPLCGRRPARKGWQSRLSLDPIAIAATFERAWNADGIAIAAGDGLLIVDLDRGHGDGCDGVATFAELIKKNGGDRAKHQPAKAKLNTPERAQQERERWRAERKASSDP